MNKKQVLFCGNNPKYLDEKLIKQSNKSNGGTAFRIPSLVNANGVLVAAIDKASTGADWGYIEIAIRRSTDGGETWSDIQTIAAPPAREISTDTASHATAFFIDPVMTVAQNGDIVMLVTYFPECKGFHDQRMLDKKKVPYASYKNKLRRVLYDRNDNFYLQLDDGSIIDKNYNSTEYKVADWFGSLYKSGEYVGNIFLNGCMGKSEIDDLNTTYGAELKVPKRSYIYMLRSSDQGLTWTEPEDVTSQFLIEKDGTFLAVAPGTGLTTSTGRIIMPLYTLRGTVAVFSDDNGKTWRRSKVCEYSKTIDEWSMIEAPDGKILGFGRQKRFGKTPTNLSTSNGKVWQKWNAANVKAPKCQKNSLVIGNQVFVSHASERKRENGRISVGTFQIDKKGQVKSIKWDKDMIELNNGFFAYSCMAKIDDETIGILYEDQPSSHLVFDKIKIK